MDMNKAFFLRNEDRAPKWHLIDACGQTVGRLATKIAHMLRGKDKSIFTSHIDGGDYVVVTNVEKITFTGKKMSQKLYRWHTGWRSGLKEVVAKDMQQKKPENILKLAVKGMVPKNKLGRAVLKKLKIYSGNNHPHSAQIGN